MNEDRPTAVADRPLRQLVRYGVVGVTQNAVGYLIYLLVTWLGVPPKIAMTVLYVAGATAGFFGNRTYTFAHDGSALSSGFRYVLAHCAGYLIQLAIQVVVTDHYGYPHEWAQALAVFVVAAFLFVTFRYFVFAKGSRDGAMQA
jgi:putative flippase GtrA